MVFRKQKKTEVPPVAPATVNAVTPQPNQVPAIAPPVQNQVQAPMQNQMQPPVQQIPQTGVTEYPWSIQEVTTETGMAIVNKTSGEVLDVTSAIVKILNILEG